MARAESCAEGKEGLGIGWGGGGAKIEQNPAPEVKTWNFGRSWSERIKNHG